MNPDPQIDLVTITRVLWRQRLLIVITSVLVTLIALAYALTATPLFTAEVAVTEVRDRDMGGGDSLARSFGGLASLAGVNLNMDGENEEAKAVLQSRRLVEEFITRNKLLPQLFRNSKKEPRLWFAVRRFRQDVLNIREDTRKGITTIEVEWTDPVTAAKWANGIIALANELVRTRVLNESNRNIAYLNEQIKHTNVLELQKVMFNLIETETKKLMFANGRIEYAFAVFDPAVPPEIRTSPRRTIIVALGMLLGFFLGVMLAFVRDSWVRGRPGVSAT